MTFVEESTTPQKNVAERRQYTEIKYIEEYTEKLYFLLLITKMNL